MKRNFSPEDEVPICKDQKSQSLKNPTSTSTKKKKSVPDQRSHTMKASYTNQKRLPQKPPPPPAEDLREEWEKYLDEVNREEEMLEEIRDENIRNFLRSQRPWILLPPTFPWIRIHELRYFTPTQIPLKLWQITARLFIISRIKVLISI